MSEMIERVARAMWKQRRKHAGSVPIQLEEWGDGSIPAANGIIEEAHAAIEAMREPTEAMADAIWLETADPCWRENAVKAWQAGINSALNDKPPVRAEDSGDVWEKAARAVRTNFGKDP